MNGGSLTDFIYFKYQQIPENLIAYIIKQILMYDLKNNMILYNMCVFKRGLKYLHQNKRLHRDLKSDNIMINKNVNLKFKT